MKSAFRIDATTRSTSGNRIPASDQTSGHGTTGQARWWKEQLAAALASLPRR